MESLALYLFAGIIVSIWALIGFCALMLNNIYKLMLEVVGDDD